HHVSDPQARLRRLRGSAQQEVPPEREAGELQRLARIQLLQSAQRTDHVGQPARMKQLPVQMMRFAVIAQIEPQNLEAAIEELLRKGQYVQRLRAALPSVQDDGRAASAPVRTGPKALQTHALATVQQQLLLRGDHRDRA